MSDETYTKLGDLAAGLRARHGPVGPERTRMFDRLVRSMDMTGLRRLGLRYATPSQASTDYPRVELR